MRIPYSSLVQKAADFEPDMMAAKRVEEACGRLAPAGRRLVGKVAAYASSVGLDSLEVAKASLKAMRLDPDIAHAMMVHMGEGGPAGISVAEPDVSTDLEILTAIACTPSAFLGACVPKPATVALLKSMSVRARRQPWNSEWFHKESLRLTELAGAPDDRDVARSAIAARMDTVWSAMAAECVYSLLREGKVCVGERLWVECAPGASLGGWMYDSLLEKLRSVPWLRAETFSELPYGGIASFAQALQANGRWGALVFDGEDLIATDSEPSVLVDWFASLAITGFAKPFYDNSVSQWVIPFVSAREGVGVMSLSASLRERPDALLRKLHLPGVSWVRRIDSGVEHGDEGQITVDVDGEQIPIMHLSNAAAIERGVFFSYDEAGERTDFWHIGADEEGGE